MLKSCARGCRAAFCLLIAGILNACAPVALGPPPTVPPAGPAADTEAYRRLKDLGQTVLRIDRDRSLIVITVRRGGSMARLGHDHIIASRTIEGFVAPESGRADLSFRLDALTVDEPELRIQAGLDTQPSSDAVEGTRRNMLTRVLDAENFPEVHIHATKSGAGNLLGVALTLHGVTRKMDIPAEINIQTGPNGAATMTASGRVSIRQSDFGIVPFSVLGGAIAVQDQLDLRFRIVAGPRGNQRND